jgi:GTPase SAR1 family protein
VFDLSSKESFEALVNWKKEFIEKANPKEPSKFPFVVIGNKTDLERQVTEEEARQWCRD